MAELPHIGVHCALKLCNRIDYTPFKCIYCNNFFCSDHRLYHNCFAESKIEQLKNNNDVLIKKQFLCSFTQCFKHEFVKIQCSLCNENFCMDHRQCEDHDCKEINKKSSDKKSNALPVFAENVRTDTPSISTQPKKVLKLNSEQQARANRATIMKLKLQNPLKISLSEQIFMFVNFFDNENADAIRTPVMLSKNWSVGKSIDSIKKQLNIKHELKKLKLSNMNGDRLCVSDDITKHFLDMTDAKLSIINN